MDIRHYLAAAERTYSYRIKAALPLTDAEMSRIERAILKYDPVSITNPHKTIFQKNPLDFPTVPGAEIYIVDVELALPASGMVLMKEIAAALGVADKFIVVRGDNDPTELETQRLDAEAEMNAEAAKAGLTPAAKLTDPTYEEAEATPELYGAAYNKRLLDYLNQVEKKKADERKVDAPNPLFKWLDMPNEATQSGDFNADIKAPTVLDGQSGDADMTPSGNLDSDKKQFRKVFKSKDGKTKLLTRNSDSVRQKGK